MQTGTTRCNEAGAASRAKAFLKHSGGPLKGGVNLDGMDENDGAIVSNIFGGNTDSVVAAPSPLADRLPVVAWEICWMGSWAAIPSLWGEDSATCWWSARRRQTIT